MQKINLTYIACLFRHDTPSIMKKRCQAALFVAATLSAQDHHVFSPLTHNRPLSKTHRDPDGKVGTFKRCCKGNLICKEIEAPH